MSVVSVEKFTFTLVATDLVESATLTKSQTTANCVPFLTTRVTTANGDAHEGYIVDAEFTGGDTIEVHTTDAVTRVIVVEVSVVEFDGSDITVEEGTFLSGGTEVINALTTSVTPANAFVQLTHETTSDNGNFHHQAVRARLTNSSGVTGTGTHVTLDRDGTSLVMQGHYWVVEDTTTNYFSVQAKDIDMSAVATNTATITSVASGKSLLIGSFMGGEPTTDNCDANTFNATLTNDTTITVDRFDNPTAVGEFHAQVIEFAGNETVQRGAFDETDEQGGAGTSGIYTATLTTTVDASLSTVHVGGCAGSHTTGKFPGTVAANVPSAHAAGSLTDGDTIRIEHYAGTAAQDISWEVIEWDTGAAPTVRRVMVRA